MWTHLGAIILPTSTMMHRSKENGGGHSCSEGSNSQVSKETWPVVPEMSSSAQFVGFTRLLLGCDFEDGSEYQHSLHSCSFYEPGFYNLL